MLKRGFLSHPLDGDWVNNRYRADIISKAITYSEENTLVISPLHLFSYLDSEVDRRKEIMLVCKEMLSFSDFFYLVDYDTDFTEGQNKELKWAEDLGLSIVRWNVFDYLSLIQRIVCKMNGAPFFAPGSGRCFNCGYKVYHKFSLDQVFNSVLTYCPVCYVSWCS